MRTNIALTPVVRDNLRRIIMAYSAPCSASPRSYFEALELAERRALHSYFDQHIVEDEELGYIALDRSEEHSSELQSLMRISYAVFCLKKKRKNKTITFRY